MWHYTGKLLEHFMNPRNVGEIENPDAVGEIGNIQCGDALRLTLKIDKDGRIEDAKFKTFGCGSAIASSSALTEMIKGKTLEEAEKISNKDIADYLGGLPEAKMHCSVMGKEALEEAIANFRGIKKTKDDKKEGKIICNCFGVSEEKIARAVRENNLKTAEEVTHYTKAGGGCGSCIPEIEAIIKRVRDEMTKKEIEKESIKKDKKMTNLQRILLIKETIDGEIRKALQKDGGDIELIDVIDNTVKVALRGACTKCPSADVTLKDWVESKLREFVSDDIVVEKIEEV